MPEGRSEGGKARQDPGKFAPDDREGLVEPFQKGTELRAPAIAGEIFGLFRACPEVAKTQIGGAGLQGMSRPFNRGPVADLGSGSQDRQPIGRILEE